MSQNQYFVVKAIMEANPIIGASSKDISGKFKLANVPQIVQQLRKRGHKVVTTMREGIAFYSLPFGTRDQEAKLTRVQKANVAAAVQLTRLVA